MNQSQDSFSPFVKMVISRNNPSETHWHLAEEGQLSVDVLETANEMIILSTLAGADIENIEISLHNDLLTIRGSRPEPFFGEETHYFHKECFWGKFSRTIVLPVDVKGDLASAEYKSGVLTITVPKQSKNNRISVVVMDE